jgi:CopG family transcriptional regulator / antitoxin EndoAI
MGRFQSTNILFALAKIIPVTVLHLSYTQIVCIIGLHEKQRATHNITLPARTLRQIDRIADRGNRSQLIDAAVRFYFTERSSARIRKLLKEGALARAERDRAVVDLFDLDDVWGCAALSSASRRSAAC